VGRTAQIIGIVNITEDSFSDGGRFLPASAAIEHARGLAASGADVIELGPASSHPDSTPVSAKDQIERMIPVVDALASDDLSLSIDATEPDVLRYGMQIGAAILNDIRGFPDAQLHADLAESRASLVVVHSLLGRERAERNDASPDEVLASIDRFFDLRLRELVRAGVAEDRLIVDPGMGFVLGRDPRASVAVLRRIPELRVRFGRPVLISVSRKSFLRRLTGRSVDQVGPATLAAELYAVRNGADYVRTHDAGALRDALAVERALVRENGVGGSD
jgi:dihydropteroate synthase type 2